MVADFLVGVATAASAGCIADFTTFPLDTAKVRLQVQGSSQTLMNIVTNEGTVGMGVNIPRYHGLVGTITTIAREEGPKALYNGLSAGLQRQMCFSSVRLGLYEPTKQFYQDLFDDGIPMGYNKNGPSALVGSKSDQLCCTLGGSDHICSVHVLKEMGEFCNCWKRWSHFKDDFYKDGSKKTNKATSLNVGTRILAGLTTGGLAVLLAQPTDVVKVRYQAAIGRHGHRYKSTLDAYRTIARSEGVFGLWRGLLPNVTRNAIINVAEIVCYDVVKDTLLMYRVMQDGMPLHFSSAVIAGFCATIVASPVDVVKTRYMNARPGEYRSAIDCAVRMTSNEGFAAFYKGFVPSVCRLVSWNIVMWMSYEQIKSAIITYRVQSEE